MRCVLASSSDCEEARSLADREPTQIRQRRAGNLHAARFGAQPRAFALRARLLAAVTRELIALELGGGLEAARELAEHAVPAAGEGGFRTSARDAKLDLLRARPVQDPLAGGRRQLPPGSR